LSRAYVRAVAARAGVICADSAQDFGIDLFLRAVTARNGGFADTGPQLVQLKSSTRAELRDPQVIHDLEVRAYDVLRPATAGVTPRVLVLLVLPEDESQWLTQTVDELILRRCAYWHSLRGAEPTTSHTTILIAIPRAQVFSADAVVTLLNRLKQGEIP
jgi:hypothetical protein